MSLPASDPRHWRFAWQGVQSLSTTLAEHGHVLHICHGEVVPLLQLLHEHRPIRRVVSHEETGVEATYRRDQAVEAWCRHHGIGWQAHQRDSICRGIKDRQGWQGQWDAYMAAPLLNPELNQLRTITLPDGLRDRLCPALPRAVVAPQNQFQPGGEHQASAWLRSFVAHRGKDYLKNLAKPSGSHESCSRLSPYLAHGHISPRLVLQTAQKAQSQGQMGKEIAQFKDRLWWRCHYIQKLETQYSIESRHINPGFDTLRKPYSAPYFEAWSTGNTGFPMVDAAMRCLRATGYLNFRIRATLATFWSYTLWQDWRPGAAWLAKVFLDFDPGIHYPQFQMQAGMTGYHPLRIFNPVAQAQKHDPDGVFIKKWVPELASLPNALVGQPWRLSPLEQAFYGCQLGQDYPLPIVDYAQATQNAKATYWAHRKRSAVAEALPAIWRKHCLPQDIVQYTKDAKHTLPNPLVTESVMYRQENRQKNG